MGRTGLALSSEAAVPVKIVFLGLEGTARRCSSKRGGNFKVEVLCTLDAGNGSSMIGIRRICNVGAGFHFARFSHEGCHTPSVMYTYVCTVGWDDMYARGRDGPASPGASVESPQPVPCSG